MRGTRMIQDWNGMRGTRSIQDWNGMRGMVDGSIVHPWLIEIMSSNYHTYQ